MKAKLTMSLVSVLAVAGIFVAGCGSSSSSSTPSGTSTGAASSESQGASSAGGEASTGTEAVPSEAQATATGDIPDNQVFLLFKDPQAGYSIRYPEGWARKGSGNDVTFQEKANLIHVAVGNGPAPTEASAVSGIAKLHKADPTVKAQAPEKVTLNGQPAVKISYSRLSAPDPVTGKRLQLVIDRYEYGHGGKVAVVDLGTPVGVDNVDAYRMISESFKWLR